MRTYVCFIAYNNIRLESLLPANARIVMFSTKFAEVVVRQTDTCARVETSLFYHYKDRRYLLNVKFVPFSQKKVSFYLISLLTG